LLGAPDDSVSLIDRFEREFEGDDFEFVGTLLIRLALSRRAREIGTPFICTGLNLEDLLCENLFRVSSGLPPAVVPARPIGDLTLVLPLWLCPKRILDGCFPKFSLENYEARYPCYSLGRNLYYSLVYSIQSQFPGFAEQLARGFSEMSLANPVTYTLDEQLGFHIERFVPFPLRQKFLRMLSRSNVLS
jgi:tRNA(Ile)-lysidine synthase TilS/MesJ